MTVSLAFPVRRRLAATSAATLGVLTLAAVIAATIATALTATDPVFPVPEVVEFGLPLVKTLTTLGASVTVGAIAVAAFMPRANPARDTALDIGASAAVVTAVLSGGTAVLTLLAFAGEVAATTFAATLGQFFTEIAVGQAWLATLLAFAGLSVLCFAVREEGAVRWIAVIAVLALIPVSLQGHAAGAGSHTVAATAQWLHSAASAVWIGGLAVLATVRHRLGNSTTQVLAIYSQIALVCFIVVAAAGVSGAVVRFESPGQLFTTTYGVLLLAKVALLTVLGVLGAWYRRSLLRSNPPKPAFWRTVAAELVIMGTAIGLAVVLTRTAPPVGERIAATPAQRLTGLDLPAEPDQWASATSWVFDPLWILLIGFAGFGYVRAVITARRHGRSWPLLRIIGFLAALMLLLFVTCGWAGVYDTYLLSVRMVVLAALTVVIPLLIVLAAPLKLLRPSEHPGPALVHPLVSAGLLAFVVLLWASPVTLRWAVEDPVGSQLMLLSSLAAGLYFWASMLAPARRHIRAVAAGAVTLAFAGAGIQLLSVPGVSPDWYAVITEGWELDLVQDQANAGIVLFSGAAAVLVAAAFFLRRKLSDAVD